LADTGFDEGTRGHQPTIVTPGLNQPVAIHDVLGAGRQIATNGAPRDGQLGKTRKQGFYGTQAADEQGMGVDGLRSTTSGGGESIDEIVSIQNCDRRRET
jgi:hypothetical protein